jgi:RHS repeat-associated protein
MTDSTATLRARYDYDSYGRQTMAQGSVESDFGFAGQYVHELSGLHLALYRAYDAEQGRWLSRDPIEEEGGVNMYPYVASDPLNKIDPLGLEFGDVWDIRASAAYYGQVASTSESGFARTGAQIANFLLNASGVLDAAEAGDLAGNGKWKCATARFFRASLKGVSFFAGAASLGRASAGGRLNRTRAGAIKFLNDNRSYSTVQKEISRALGGQGHFDLHHWWRFRSQGGGNAGWNLVAIPASWNRYMNTAASTRWMARASKYGIPSSLAAGGLGGMVLGQMNDDCDCK